MCAQSFAGFIAQSKR